MKIALITISLKAKYVPRGPVTTVLASICSDNDLTLHRRQAIIGINYALTYWHTYMRPSTIMPGYLLGAKPFPGPMLIISPGFILNYTHNEHELDPNLCVFIEHYDISKQVCGHWIYPIQIESKQTLFYVPWTVKDRTHAVRVTSIKKWLCWWPQGGASGGAQGSEICTRLGRWVIHIFASAVGELLWDR